MSATLPRLSSPGGFGGEWSRGQTVVDHLGVTGREPNVEVVLEANRDRFLAMLHEAVGREQSPP